MTSASGHGLPTATVEQICHVLAKHSEVEKAILYGSRAKGNFRPGSDIDLALVGPKLTLSVLLKIETELDDLLLPQEIDLALYDSIDSASLVDHIKRVGQIFYIQE